MMGVSEAVLLRPGASESSLIRRLLAGRWSDWQLLRAGLVAVDLTMVGVAVLAAGLLRLRLDGILLPNGLTPGYHFLASVLVAPVLLLLFWAHHLYDPDQILAGTHEYAQVGHAATYGILLALGASYFAGNSQFVSRAWLLLVWAFCFGCVSLGRFTMRRVVRWFRRRGLLRTRVIIVGASTFGVTIAEQLRAATNEGLDVVGFLDEYIPLGHELLDDISVVGRPDDLLSGAAAMLADEFILVPQALPYERQEEISRLMASRARPVLRIAVSSTELVTRGVRVSTRGDVPLVAVQRARIRGLESVWKRSFDVVGAAIALVALAPVVAVILLRGYLAVRRPLLRRYSIQAMDGGHWSLWLFDSQVVSWPLLRGTPALLAVLSGRLSLVGPRPTQCHSNESAAQPTGLTAVRPGLTGPWRLSGPAASVAEQTVQDLSYVRNYSIWEDVHIVAESLRRLRRGALPELIGRWHDDSMGTPNPCI